MSLTDDQIFNIGWDISQQDIKTIPEYKLAFAKAIEAEATKPQEPVVWFAFADNNGPVPLELYGFDEKSCKYAVLENALALGWKGSLEGYLFQKGWTIQPLYTTPQPCPSCQEKQSAIDVWEGRYTDLTAKCAELEAERDEEREARKELDKQVNQYHALVQQLKAERDALKNDLADVLDVKNGSGPTALSMVITQREALAERDALKKQNNAYATLTKAQEGRLVEYGGQKAKWLDAVATLDSEKEANAILTQERDALAITVQKTREALQEHHDNSLRYTIAKRRANATCGEFRINPLSELAESGYMLSLGKRTEEALALPDTSEIIKRHDAKLIAVIRSVPCSNCGMVSKAAEIGSSL